MKLQPKLFHAIETFRFKMCTTQKTLTQNGCLSAVLVEVTCMTEMSVKCLSMIKTRHCLGDFYTSEIQPCLKADHIS